MSPRQASFDADEQRLAEAHDWIWAVSTLNGAKVHLAMTFEEGDASSCVRTRSSLERGTGALTAGRLAVTWGRQFCNSCWRRMQSEVRDALLAW